MILTPPRRRGSRAAGISPHHGGHRGRSLSGGILGAVGAEQHPRPHPPGLMATDLPPRGPVAPGAQQPRASACRGGSCSCESRPCCLGKHHVPVCRIRACRLQGEGLGTVGCGRAPESCMFCMCFLLGRRRQPHELLRAERFKVLTVDLGSSCRRTACPQKELIITCVSTRLGQT